MKQPVPLQPRHRLWLGAVRSARLQHAAHRCYGIDYHLCHDRQALHWPISRRLPRSVTVANAESMFFKPIATLSTLCNAPNVLSHPPNIPSLQSIARVPLSPVRLFSEIRGISGMMDRPATRAAAARIRRGVHTSSPKRVSPAAVEPVESALSDTSSVLESGPRTGKKKAASIDPESDEEVPTNAAEVQESLARPPPVNSDYLPLPWKGRLGYACLNTYLRYANPPVFSSRTCRIASILENRHPLQDPSQPYHSTKNRPDRSKPAVIARGQEYVQSLGVANARDIVKMLRWNDRYGIKFMRLSSEMFPFASHDVYGYKLAPFASEVLADAGRVAAELGHRLTMHPGQFTQLGSPRKEVIENSIRDLEFHSELLQLLKLPPQQNRDAVMILHMGGVFGDKGETLDRFRKNYKALSQDIKNRLVLENDDVSWSVHDLLPICEELNIPLVLDFHHHNIVFDSDKLREGTLDIMQLYDRIRATWTRKNITQKMHYSEPTPDAITPRQRRKHNPRVATLPPCDPTMDLMIEAKDKEQAVFELMRKFKLPGYERISELTPHVREDENKPWKPPKRTKKSSDYIDLSKLTPPPLDVLAEEVSMGGPEGKVYWPPEHEEWLRPKKRVMSRKQPFPLPDSVEFPQKKTKPRSTTNRKKRKSSRASTPTSSSEKETLKPPPSARRSTRAKRVSYAEDNSA